MEPLRFQQIQTSRRTKRKRNKVNERIVTALVFAFFNLNPNGNLSVIKWVNLFRSVCLAFDLSQGSVMFYDDGEEKGNVRDDQWCHLFVFRCSPVEFKRDWQQWCVDVTSIRRLSTVDFALHGREIRLDSLFSCVIASLPSWIASSVLASNELFADSDRFLLSSHRRLSSFSNRLAALLSDCRFQNSKSTDESRVKTNGWNHEWTSSNECLVDRSLASILSFADVHQSVRRVLRTARRSTWTKTNERILPGNTRRLAWVSTRERETFLWRIVAFQRVDISVRTRRLWTSLCKKWKVIHPMSDQVVNGLRRTVALGIA